MDDQIKKEFFSYYFFPLIHSECSNYTNTNVYTTYIPYLFNKNVHVTNESKIEHLGSQVSYNNFLENQYIVYQKLTTTVDCANMTTKVREQFENIIFNDTKQI